MKHILKIIGIGLVACLGLAIVGTFLMRGNSPATPATNSSKVATAPVVQVTLMAPLAATVPADATQVPQVTEPTQAVAPAVEPTSVPVVVAEPQLFLGDAVEQGGLSLVALSVEDPAIPGMFYKAETGKKLVAVEIVVGNVSAETTSVNPLNASLVDTEGFAYQIELGGRDGQIATLNLARGEQVRGWVAFKVPDNSKPASIKYKRDLFGGDTIQAQLATPPDGHAPVQASAQRVPPQLAKLGESTEANGVSLSAAKVDDPAVPGMFYKAHDGMKLVAVEVVLGNTAAETVSANVLYFYLVDSKGFVYSAELGATDKQIDTLDLAKGEKVRGYVAFTIPADATVESIRYALPFGSTSVQVGLV